MAIANYMSAPQVRQPSTQQKMSIQQPNQQQTQNKWNQQWGSQNQQQQRPGMVSAFGGGGTPPKPYAGQPMLDAFPRPGTKPNGGNMVMPTPGNPYGGGTSQQPYTPSGRPVFSPPTGGQGQYSPPPFKPFSPPPFNPQYPQYGGQSPSMPPRTPTNPQGVYGDFLKTPGLFDPNSYNGDEAKLPGYLNQISPLLQMQQNAYQYATDSNQASNQFNATHGLAVNQTGYQQALSSQQQQMAEWIAQAQQGNWQQQFGHTQNMDYAGLGLSQQEIDNQYAIGMGQNQVGLHQANQQLAGTLGAANIYNQGNMYQADQQLAGQLGAANTYAQGGIQEALYGMQGQLGAANMGMQGQLGSANIYAQGGVQEAQLGLQGQLGAANIYGGAQRYGSDQELAAAKYQWDMQQRMNQAMMENNLQVANTQAYGRSQAPQTNWARSWS
jgi:hypothetical protein